MPAVWRVAPEGGGGMRGLILHDDEVRALRDAGEVTMVRPMKPQPPEGHWWAETPVEMALAAQFYPGENGRKGCPFGTRGERRWIRHTFYHAWRNPSPGAIRAEQAWDPFTCTVRWRIPAPDGYEQTIRDCEPDLTQPWWEKRPSIYMPRWASLLTAECASVTVQRCEDVWEWHAVYRRLAA